MNGVSQRERLNDLNYLERLWSKENESRTEHRPDHSFGNRLTEPQFNTYLPAGVGAYVTRLRMAGKYRKPLAELKPQLIEAAQALSDVKPSSHRVSLHGQLDGERPGP